MLEPDALTEKMQRIRHLRVLLDALADSDLPLPSTFRGFGSFTGIGLAVDDAVSRLALMGAMEEYGFTFGQYEPYLDAESGGRLPFHRNDLQVGYLYGSRDAFLPPAVATFGLVAAILGEDEPEDEPEGPLPGDDEDEPVDFDMPPTVRGQDPFVARSWAGGVREYIEPAR